MEASSVSVLVLVMGNTGFVRVRKELYQHCSLLILLFVSNFPEEEEEGEVQGGECRCARHTSLSALGNELHSAGPWSDRSTLSYTQG